MSRVQDTKSYYDRAIQFLKYTAPAAVILGLVAHQINHSIKFNQLLQDFDTFTKTQQAFNSNLKDRTDVTYDVLQTYMQVNNVN
jgi:hypothetical protein